MFEEMVFWVAFVFLGLVALKLGMAFIFVFMTKFGNNDFSENDLRANRWIIKMVIASFFLLWLMVFVHTTYAQTRSFTSSFDLTVRDVAHGTDFQCQITPIDLRGFILDQLTLSAGYERYAGKYFLNTDYRAGMLGGYVSDYRVDIRGINELSMGYLYSGIPMVRTGAGVVFDKSDQWFPVGVIEIDIYGIRGMVKRGNDKTIYRGELDWGMPLRKFLIFQGYAQIRAGYYDDLDYEPYRFVRIGGGVKIK